MKTHIHVDICNDTLKLLKQLRQYWEAREQEIKSSTKRDDYEKGYANALSDCVKDLEDEIGLLESALDEVKR